jgi:hypothetical protein
VDFPIISIRFGKMQRRILPPILDAEEHTQAVIMIPIWPVEGLPKSKVREVYAKKLTDHLPSTLTAAPTVLVITVHAKRVTFLASLEKRWKRVMAP